MQTSGGCRDLEFLALTLSRVSYSSCTVTVLGTTFHETFCRSPFTVLTTRREKQRGTCRLRSGCQCFWERAVCLHRAIQRHKTSVTKKLTDLDCNPTGCCWASPFLLQPQETSAQQLFQACCRSGRNTALNKAGGQEIHHISEVRRPALEGEQLFYPPVQGLSFLQALAQAGLQVEMRG